jgi:hypothetical protein
MLLVASAFLGEPPKKYPTDNLVLRTPGMGCGSYGSRTSNLKAGLYARAGEKQGKIVRIIAL